MTPEILNFLTVPILAFMGWYLKKMVTKIEEVSTIAITLPGIIEKIEMRIDSIEESAKEAIALGRELKEKQSQIIILERNLETAFKHIDELRNIVNRVRDDFHSSAKELVRIQSKLG